MSDHDSSRDLAAARASAGAKPRRWRPALWLLGAVAVIAVGAALAIGGLIWSLHHERGSTWLLGRVPGLTLVEPQGSLIGDFSATRLVYVVPGVGELRLEAPHWRALAASR